MDCKEFRASRGKNILKMSRAERAAIVHHFRTCRDCAFWQAQEAQKTIEDAQKTMPPEKLRALSDSAQLISSALRAADGQDPEFRDTIEEKPKKQSPKPKPPKDLGWQARQ